MGPHTKASRIMSKTSLTVVLSLLAAVPAANADEFQVTNLVSNQTGVAQVTDPDLVNAWGISASATSPIWVSDNGTDVATLYSISGGTVSKVSLTVSVPGGLTGQVFNSGAGGGAFNGDDFLFVSQNGTVSGWRGSLGTTAETLVAGSSANDYTGVAYGTVGSNSYLYAANFETGNIDVIPSGGAPALSGNFTDPNLPADYAPFNIQDIGGLLYVTYAEQDGSNAVDGAGLGFVDVFDLNGNFVERLTSNGPLDAPWGLALAPAGFGEFAGDLLVGNHGDGEIDAYSTVNGAFEGALDGTTGSPLTLDGLWGLQFGNGGSGGNAGTLYFTSGPDDGVNGLFGSLTVPAAVPEPASLFLLAGLLPVLAWLRRRRVV